MGIGQGSIIGGKRQMVYVGQCPVMCVMLQIRFI